MQFSSDAVVRHPPEPLYRLCRERLTEAVHGVANVDFIEETARVDRPGRSEITNVWHGRGFIPKIAREVVAPDMLVCDVFVTWLDAELRCTFDVATHALTECVKSSGEILFRPLSRGRTRLTMQGDFTLDVTSVSAVPRRWRRIVERQAERFLIATLPRNVRGVARRLERALARTEVEPMAG